MSRLCGSWWWFSVVLSVGGFLGCGGESAGSDPSGGGSGDHGGRPSGGGGGRAGGGSAGGGGDAEAGQGGDSGEIAGAGGAEPDRPAVAYQFSHGAYEVEAVVTLEWFSKPFDFTARFSKEAGNWTLLAAVPNTFDRAALAPSPEGYTAVGEVTSDDFPESTFVMRLWATRCLELLLTKLDIATVDEDGDDVVDRFTARGEGVVSDYICPGDDVSNYEEPFVLEFSGKLDTNAPVVKHVRPFNPLLPSFFVSNEPLSGDSTLTLEGPSTYELAPEQQDDDEGDEGPFWRFGVPPLTRFGATFDVIAEGTDLSGHAIPALDSLQTLPDPGIAPQDGFESDAPALAGLTLVETDPISGSRSLYVPNGPCWTLHLSRGAGTTLRFKARVAWQDDDYDIEDVDIFAGVVVRVAVVGGTNVSTRYLHGPTVNGIDGALEEVQEFEVPLDEPGSDVMVSFEMDEEDSDCGLAYCDGAPALIDDLRIE